MAGKIESVSRTSRNWAMPPLEALAWLRREWDACEAAARLCLARGKLVSDTEPTVYERAAEFVINQIDLRLERGLRTATGEIAMQELRVLQNCCRRCLSHSVERQNEPDSEFTCLIRARLIGGNSRAAVGPSVTQASVTRGEPAGAGAGHSRDEQECGGVVVRRDPDGSVDLQLEGGEILTIPNSLWYRPELGPPVSTHKESTMTSLKEQDRVALDSTWMRLAVGRDAASAIAALAARFGIPVTHVRPGVAAVQCSQDTAGLLVELALHRRA